MYSHALLLRLFLSNSFFSVHVALQYLRLYSENIGITHYLTRRLSDVPIEELWDVWGSICHLLVSKPSKSVALERFVIRRSEQSTHLALLTFWFMQASLSDLAMSKRNTPSFVICQRVLHKCHEIIFDDPTSSSSSPYSSLAVPRFLTKKVKPHFEPAVVGIGCVLAGVPGLPQVTIEVGDVAIAQGQRETSMTHPRPANVEEGDTNNVMKIQSTETLVSNVEDQETATPSDEEDEFDLDISPDFVVENKSRPVSILNETDTTSTSQPQLQRQTTSVFTKPRKTDVKAARTTPALIQMHPTSVGLESPQPNPFTSLPHTHAHSHCLSTPAISDIKKLSGFMAFQTTDNLLHKYDLKSQCLLLRSHYLRLEVQFILGLESIATKLLVVPRPARVSALRAELTNLNHRLPAEVCLPLWCHTSDIPTPRNGKPKPHHRIVRIPPGEGVVLNSAERAPYLLIVEILHDDLDFDPSKRQNIEILQKMISKENGHVRSLSDPLDIKTAFERPLLDPSAVASLQNNIIPSNEVSSDLPEVEEEVDVVEQLYGSDLLSRDTNFALDESIAIPPVPKNKMLDLEVWSRSSSTTSSPGLSENVPSEPTLPSPDQLTMSTIAGATDPGPSQSHNKTLTLEEYSERMHTAAIMLAQLNANIVLEPVTTITPNGAPSVGTEAKQSSSSTSRWILNSSWRPALSTRSDSNAPHMRMRLQRSEAEAIRDRIMREMLSLEEERMGRMSVPEENWLVYVPDVARGSQAVDDNIIRQELSKVDPSAIAFRESWTVKKKRIKASSPYGHLANWDCFSLIVKTGTDLRQEQLAVQLIREFGRIWKEESCSCWVRHFHILITGPFSGLVETITDAVSLHSLKKAEYARRMAMGQFGYVTLFDYFKSTYGDPSSAKFARAQRNFAQSLAGYSLVTYLLQIKDRHNGNILIDKDGHILHIDFGFMLSNSPGNLGFEAAPFKLSYEYVEVLGGIEGEPFKEFKRLFHEGFEAARKHCDRIITIVEMMQKDSSLPCFTAFKEQTSVYLRERFQTSLTRSLAEEHSERLIMSSLGSTWTRLYDSYQYYSQSIL